jgi:hypothetical protein
MLKGNVDAEKQNSGADPESMQGKIGRLKDRRSVKCKSGGPRLAAIDGTQSVCTTWR